MSARVLRTTALALVLLLAGCGDRTSSSATTSASPFTSTDITGVPWGRDFQLTDHNGVPRRLADFKGKAVMLYFGYIHCPDMCPTTLTDMAAVVRQLGKDGKRVQGLFVTVDPRRDTPKVLAQFVPAFYPNFLGLYADEGTTAALAKDFKIFYHAQPADAQGNYTVDHSGGVLIFDPQGRLRLFVGGQRNVAAIAADIETLLKE
ncbi:MAG: SCO family protein [Rhodoferax sp.]